MKDTIKEYLAGQYDAYVKDLETLTNIDSGNGDLQGTEAANKFVAEKMQELGAVTEYRVNMCNKQNTQFSASLQARNQIDRKSVV